MRPHLLAVVRETLSNAARHAQASAVAVRLEVTDEVVLTVTDDGIGYVDTGRRSGLRNMADRAESLGGTFEVRQLRAGRRDGRRLAGAGPALSRACERPGPCGPGLCGAGYLRKPWRCTIGSRSHIRPKPSVRPAEVSARMTSTSA